MMCSIEELGSTRDMYPEAPENGIYIFKDDARSWGRCSRSTWTYMMLYLSMKSHQTV